MGNGKSTSYVWITNRSSCQLTYVSASLGSDRQVYPNGTLKSGDDGYFILPDGSHLDAVAIPITKHWPDYSMLLGIGELGFVRIDNVVRIYDALVLQVMNCTLLTFELVASEDAVTSNSDSMITVPILPGRSRAVAIPLYRPFKLLYIKTAARSLINITKPRIEVSSQRANCIVERHDERITIRRL